MGDPNKEVSCCSQCSVILVTASVQPSDEDIEKANEERDKAMSAFSEGKRIRILLLL